MDGPLIKFQVHKIYALFERKYAPAFQVHVDVASVAWREVKESLRGALMCCGGAAR